MVLANYLFVIGLACPLLGLFVWALLVFLTPRVKLDASVVEEWKKEGSAELTYRSFSQGSQYSPTVVYYGLVRNGEKPLNEVQIGETFRFVGGSGWWNCEDVYKTPEGPVIVAKSILD